MATLQEHLLQMLREIDITCDELGIRYALYGISAQQAMENGGFAGTCCELHVMMAARDALVLKRALLAMDLPNRTVEDLSCNPRLASNHIRYIDTSTTLFDREDPVRYSALGVALIIHPLFSKRFDVAARSLTQAMLFLNGGNSYSPYLLSDGRRLGMNVGRALISAFGELVPAKVLFELIRQDKGLEEGGSCYHEDHVGAMNKYPARFLFDTQRISFSGVETSIPRDIEGYLKAHFRDDRTARLVRPLKTETRLSIICDADTPYEETIEYMLEEGFDIRQMQADEFEHNRWYNETYMYWKGVASCEYALARMSRDRIDIYLSMQEDMDALRQAYVQDDVATLESLLSPYLDKTDEFMRRKCGFYINQEIFEMASKVWKHRGKADYAKRVYSLVPESYKRTDIDSMLAPYR